MEDTISSGKFTLRFVLWFVIFNLCAGIVFGFIGTMVLSSSGSLLISGIINAIVGIATALVSCYFATKSAIGKLKISRLDLSKILISISIVFAIIVTVSCITIYNDFNKTYQDSVNIAIEKASGTYNEMNEEEKAEFDKKKDAILKDTKKTIDMYVVSLIFVNIFIYVAMIPFERKLLLNRCM